MKKFSKALIFILVFVMVLTGCTPAANNSNTPDADTQKEQTSENQNDDEQESADDAKDETEESSQNNNSTSEEGNSGEENAVTDEDNITMDEDNITTDEDEEQDLTSTQRNSINMLNYITVLTQQINASKGSRIYLETVQDSLQNDIYPNAVDTKTQSQINNLWKTIDGYRMIDVKRERLDYIYEQNKAQALRQAIPNPLGLLSTVQSGGLLKTAASVLYMAVDSATSYQAASTQADLKYLQDNWELDDAESSELSSSQLNLLNYMINMVRANDFPGEWALNYESVQDFVKWTNEPNVVSRIAWFESNEETYKEFRTYWLELAKSYYEQAEEYEDYESYEKCLEAIAKYEDVATRIFRKDYDYAEILPMVILSAKETMEINDYVNEAAKYAKIIEDNCDEKDWALRYFVAQIYVDLYANTKEELYLSEAYRIAFENVNILAKEQEELNSAYLADIDKAEAGDDATKREKQEVKEYNKLLEEKRKKELPPVSEAFYLNCDLMFALADKLDISQKERTRIDSIIHEEGNNIFLTEALDNRFWASKNVEAINSDDIKIEFDGKELVIPATCMTDRTEIKVTTSNGTELDDWIVKKVKRSKNNDCSEFMVTLTSKQGKDYKYTAGEKITITVIPVADTPDEVIEFTYKAVSKKTLGVIKSIKIERETK